MRKVVGMGMAAVLLAVALGGCATSNQKAESPAGTEAASLEAAEAKGTEAGGKEEESGESEGNESGEAAGQEEYAVKPRQITGRKIKLGLIPVTMNTAYTMTINGAKKHIAETGDNIELIVQAPSSNASTITEQGNILETMIQQKVDAIALATESDESMLPYLREAAEADIPVFLFNMTEINEKNIYYVSSIGYDQEQAGREIGAWINENLGADPQKIAVLEGYAGVVNTKRMDGFYEALEGNGNLPVVASQTAEWTREKGQSVTESILTSNPDITILYGPYDEMVLGGLTVIKERNLLDQIAVVGFGCTKDGVAAIEAGEMRATIDVGEYGTGFDIVDAVTDFCINGKEVEKVINRPSKVYDKENLSELDRVIFE
ncbi:sugar ABC transporter substrate-binding protein [Clostridiaceae bacterium]|nr:sugar ABC transporter substrate-binding protein [Clostridiaceae bacterium]RKI17933.1 sugar ABC transporter substrate-binding protein [bacterium 1XD21-70]